MAGKPSGPPVKRIRTSSVRYGHSVNPRDRSRTRGPIHYNRHGKVTDGNHRLQEARRRGDRYIEAQYYPDSDIYRGCALVVLAYGGTLTALAASIATVIHNLPV